MVSHPEEYRWSSYHANALGRTDMLVTPHPDYMSINKNTCVMATDLSRLFQNTY